MRYVRPTMCAKQCEAAITMAAPAPAPPSAAPHILPCTVFIGDTDAYQMMYHTNYLVYYARARADVLGSARLRGCSASAASARSSAVFCMGFLTARSRSAL